MAQLESNDPSRQLPLKILLSFPFFWKPSKICNFIKAMLPEVRGVQESLEVAAFKERIDKEARELINTLWPGESWKQVLEEIDCTIWEECPEPPVKKKNKSEPHEPFTAYKKQTNHFEILSKKYDKKNVVDGVCKYEKQDSRYSEDDFSSVICLLKIIRDKLDHSSDIPPGRHDAIGWFRKGKLDHNLCIAYWIRHFPRLFPFLWWKFHQFPDKGDNFKDFFQSRDDNDSLEQYQQRLPIGLAECLSSLRDAILDDLKRGGVDGRFSNRHIGNGLTLEFRTMEVDLLQRILHGSITLKIQFSSRTVSCVWLSSPDLVNEKDDSVISKYECVNNDENLIIVIGNSIDHVKKQLLREKYDDATGNVIVFTGRGESEIGVDDKTRTVMEDIAKCIFRSSDISELEHPIKLCDVMEVTTENIEEIVKGWSVIVHAEEVTMSSLLPLNDFSVAKSILSILQGPFLNQLLKGKTATLFKGHMLPSNSEIYLKRRLAKRLAVTWRFINASSSSDIFLFTDLKEQEDPRHLLGKNTGVTIVEDVNLLPDLVASGCRILVLKRGINEFYELIKSGSGDWCKNKRIRVVHYHQFSFMCHSTHCFNSAGIVQCTHDRSCESCKSGEDEFIDFMQSRSEKFIVIGDKPGMGKSQMLIRIARKLSAYKNRFVIFLESNQFGDMLGTDKVTKLRIQESIIEAVCANEFEKSLLEHWITQHDFSSPKVELLCDGLDEMKPEFRERIFNAFEILQIRFPSVRVWATLRDHMLPKIQTKFDCHGYKLEPFRKEDQIKFLAHHWMEYWRKCRLSGEENIGAEPCSTDLEFLAKQCTELPISANEVDIAGVPLQCRMIAEIHERRVITANFKLEENKQYSLAELYDKMIERKLEVFLKEKVKLYNLSMSHHIANRERDHMDRAHVYFALKLIFSESVADRFKDKLLSYTEDWNELEITVKDQGLIQTLDPLMFIHRTFAEFIVARFVYKVLTNGYSNVSRNDEDFQDLLWTHVLATESPVGEQGFKFPVLCQLADAICYQRDSSRCSMFCGPLHDIVYKLVITNNTEEFGFEVDAPNFVRKIVVFDTAQRLRKGRLLLGMIFATCYSKDILDLFFEGLRVKLFQFCRFVVEYNPHFMSQNWHILRENNATQYGILHLCILDIPAYFQRLYNVISMEMYKVEVGNNVRFIKDFVTFLLCKDRQILHDRDTQGRTPLLLLFSRQPTFHTSVVKPGIHPSVGSTSSVDPDSIMRDGKHFTQCVERIYHELLSIFAKYGVDFNVKDYNGSNALHFAIENGFSDSIIDVLIRNGCSDFVLCSFS